MFKRSYIKSNKWAEGIKRCIDYIKLSLFWGSSHKSTQCLPFYALLSRVIVVVKVTIICNVCCFVGSSMFQCLHGRKLGTVTINLCPKMEGEADFA